MEDLLQKYQDQVHLISDFLYHGYSNLVYDKPVDVNDSSVLSLELVRMAQTVRAMDEFSSHGGVGSIIENIPTVIRKDPLRR